MTLDASGKFTASGLATVSTGQAYLTATATNLTTNDTSQFSSVGVLAVAGLNSSANPSVYGQPVTFTASLSPFATGPGTPTGNVDFVDTTSNTDLGTVALTNGIASVPTSALAVGSHVIEAVYAGDATFLVTSAILTQVVTQSIYVLNKKESGALTVSGHGSINIPGNLIVDSNSPTALVEKGNATITAASIQVVGGVKQTGNATMTPAAVTGVAYVADPLAGLVAPTGGTSQGSVKVTTGSLTINPGVYKSIRVSGNGSLTLNPGVYIITTGGIAVTGNGSLNGSGVVLYAAGGDFCGSDDRGGITLSGNGTFNVSAPATGPYAGVVIFQARDNTRAISLSKNAMAGIGGTLYAPKALLYLTGDAAIQASLVVNELTLTGEASSTLSVDGSSSGAGTAGQLLAGDLRVYVNDPSGLFSADELARIQDAVNAVDATVEPYGVSVTETTDSTAANVTVDFGTTSAAGGYADGVLGCFTSAGEITLIQGWNWYAGAGASAVGSGQYDIETAVVHELGHALGLGHSSSATSVMYATLATGTAERSLTTADLAIPDPSTAADALHAAPPLVRAGSDGSEAGRALERSLGDAFRNRLFAMVGREQNRRTGTETLAPSFAAHDAVFAELGGDTLTALDQTQPAMNSPIFAGQTPSEHDSFLEVPLFPDPSQDGVDDSGKPDSCRAEPGHETGDTMPALLEWTVD